MFTKANSAATNRPFRTTRNSAATIPSVERARPSRTIPQILERASSTAGAPVLDASPGSIQAKYTNRYALANPI
jgi:hypothetical protein